ncbi:MAG: hypothetical protein ACJ8GW_19545 [Massilia sp.]
MLLIFKCCAIETTIEGGSGQQLDYAQLCCMEFFIDSRDEKEPALREQWVLESRFVALNCLICKKLLSCTAVRGMGEAGLPVAPHHRVRYPWMKNEAGAVLACGWLKHF